MIFQKIKTPLFILSIGVFAFFIYFTVDNKYEVKDNELRLQKEILEVKTIEMPKIIYSIKKMVLVPGGTFLMGSESSSFSDELPVHSVVINSFYMDETPVTYRDFLKYIEAGGVKAKYWEYETYNQSENPVTGIDWYHAVDYCNWRNAIEKLPPGTYRLPTEAEFEYAARGGLEGKNFPWGDEFNPSFANFDNERGVMKGDWWRLAKVKDTPPNNYGLYGMSGNVWHWTNDWYDSNYYEKSPKDNPMGPEIGRTKVVRGGSWGSISPDYLRTAKRSYTTPSNYNYDIGFRCVRLARGTILENPEIDEKTPYQFYQYKIFSENELLEDVYGKEFLNRLTQFITENYPNSIYFQTEIDEQNVINPKQMATLIIETMREYNINPLFLVGILASESGFGTVSFPRWYNNPMAYHWQNVLMKNGLPTYEPTPSHNRKYKNLEIGFREFAKGIRRDIYQNAAKKDLDAFHLLYVGYRADEWMYTITKIYKEVLGIDLGPHLPANNIGEYIYTDWNKSNYPEYLAIEGCQGIKSIQTTKKIVALTFDDGPSEYTKDILTILEKYNIKATFFVIGENVSRYPEILKRISENGHIIGNHSFSHTRFTTLSEKIIEEELKKTNEIIYKLTGVSPTLFRPPYGVCSNSAVKIIKQLGYKIIVWSSAADDYSPLTTPEKIKDDLLKRVKPGGIILLHDSAPPQEVYQNRFQTVKALPEVIKMLKKEGYNFLTIPELLDINPYLPAPDIINKFLNWGHLIPSIPRLIDTIIIHSSYDALGKDPYNVEGVINEYKLYGVSPHYLIDRDGNIYRLVEEKNIAYHAGVSKMPDGRTNINNFSIGIEVLYHENETPNEIQYEKLVKLVQNLKSQYKIKYILGHNDVAPSRKTDPWNFDWQKFNEMLKN